MLESIRSSSIPKIAIGRYSLLQAGPATRHRWTSLYRRESRTRPALDVRRAFRGPQSPLPVSTPSFVHKEQNLIRWHLSDHDFGISFDAAPSPFAGQYHHLHLNSLEGFDINGQPLPPPHQILPSNAASPSNARENDVGSPMGDETLIRRAANNLAARPVCEYTTSQENPYPRLQWETPRYPADYLTPSPNGPSKSQSPSRKRY